MGSPRPYILAETNWKTVKDQNYNLAVLPWGAIEAHNYHLPYATDVMQCDYVAAEAARKAWEEEAQVIVLPTVPFGVNTGQLDVKLCLNMNPSTQLAVLNDIADVLNRQQISKLVILNGHGGNNFKQMLRTLNVDYPEVFSCALNWYQAADADQFFDEPGDHAGELETSAMMHILPDLVLPLSEAGDGRARSFAVQGLNEQWTQTQRKWTEVTEDTGVGDPSQSTPEKGEAFLDATTDAIAQLFIDLSNTPNQKLYE
ncbi:creatininase family protein [Fodinibius salsisoli]|uniref:Creatininase family protein n=1 Tax=Fodinibius salsisoli TaxID=2820877 RepID=A0ABT3PRE1_9BACT|nr:creatininase family protein [Fodinibius salsisoli]MCW9708406.1 creatininase family protein [Fodinibius salsisoli]